MDVVVVESSAKAKAIGKYLGGGYTVLACYGHVSDLPAKEGSVDPERDFAMVYETGQRARRALGAIRAALQGAGSLVLATDPDREGEAIAWQIWRWLEEKGAVGDRPVRRVVFHEVTADAVREAMTRPRAIDMALVRAQQARRALDYLVGFHLSPVLWRKVPGARSAGRVQSVALRLVCEREAEIESFTAHEYWSVEARVMAGAGDTFTARLTHLDGAELDRFALETATMAEQAAQRVRTGVFRVEALERKEVRRNPTPPFTTSTLQQDASRKLGFRVRQTMRLAQTLYEGIDLDGEVAGLVTYMRTDSVTLSKSALAEARGVVRSRFGAEYLPARARRFHSSVRNAQEAHEAIRPTDFARSPESLEGRIGPDEAGLYGLIWKRALASQMAPARLDRVRVDLASTPGDVVLSATGSVVAFDGFLRIYREGRDDADDEAELRLPAMMAGEPVFASAVHTTQRFTAPPPRYTEAGLVRGLEELGIGRPSTYAAIVGVLQEREYVVLHRRRFVATERGRVVTAFLAAFFARWVAYEFTARLEQDLDRIAGGALGWKGVLHAFWGDFDAALERVGPLERRDMRTAIEGALAGFMFGPGDKAGERPCPSCPDGQLMLKLGRRGAFVGCSNFPACRFTRPLAAGTADGGEGDKEPKPLGEDPHTGLGVTLRRGRYGLYVQSGEDTGDAEAVTVSVPKTMAPEEITLDVARALLALPREVGIHPASGKTILAGTGRFGPWLKHGRTYISIPDDDDVLTIGLNRAVMLIAQKQG